MCVCVCVCVLCVGLFLSSPYNHKRRLLRTYPSTHPLGRLTSHPTSTARFAASYYDANKDDIVTREEFDQKLASEKKKDEL